MRTASYSYWPAGDGVVKRMRRALIISGAVWASSILGLTPVTAVFAAEAPPISMLFRQATEQVEHELGQRLAVIIHLDTPKMALFDVATVRMTVLRDNAGLKMITAYRQSADEQQWQEAVGVLAAFIAPSAEAEERRNALKDLRTATQKVGTSAKQIARTWILAANNPKNGGQMFMAYQVGVQVADKTWDQPPSVWLQQDNRP